MGKFPEALVTREGFVGDATVDEIGGNAPGARLSEMLEGAIQLDRLIKGHGLGNVWDDLESLLLALANTPASGKTSSTSGES